MIVRAIHLAPVLLALILVSEPVHSEIHKCRQGERVIYQEFPCPAGSLNLVPPDSPSLPSAYAVEEARNRAKNDVAAALALRKREDQAALAQEQIRATASKREADCTRLLGRIENTKTKSELSKHQKKTLRTDQLKYRKECE